MSADLVTTVAGTLPGITGYVYPNEQSLVWGVLIVVYPYVTGLVAGAFIMASLVRVFKVKALEPAYRLSMLTSLAFLLAAPLPLLFHLGHPGRFYEIMMTPHKSSPMAMFGFVYAWYLMAVLLLELWFDFRRDFVEWSRTERGLPGVIYRLFTLGVTDVSEPALRLDAKMSKIISIIGIPSAFLLHGYVGFIFGSIKANPWWGNVLMPVIFVFSAVVSGIALCLLLYLVVSWGRRLPVDMACLDMMGRFLFCALVVDMAFEGLDWIHRLYAAEESIHVLISLASGKLFYTLLVGQACLGTLLPFLLLVTVQLFRKHIPVVGRKRMYFASGALILMGVLAMRWNVVIGGQLFSKSLRGFMTYKMQFAGSEGWLVSLGLMILPFLILGVFLKYFLPVKHLSLEAGEETVGGAI
jgi:Ni/Fe-hydrogenase subunit HybB-like protein